MYHQVGPIVAAGIETVPIWANKVKIVFQVVAVATLALNFIVQMSHDTNAGTLMNFSGVVQRSELAQARVYSKTIYSFTDEVALPIPFSSAAQVTLYDASTSRRLSHRVINLGARGRAVIINLSGSTQQVFTMCPTDRSNNSKHCVRFHVTKLG